MNDLLPYAPLLIAAAIAWAGYYNVQVIHAANMDRRKDHREMMERLEEISREIASIDLLVGGIATAVDELPKADSDYLD